MTVLLEDVTPVARKGHQCNLCLGPIATGEKYRRQRGIFDGEPTTYKCHMLCDYLYWQAWHGLDLYDDEQPDFDEDIRPRMADWFRCAFLFAGRGNTDV